MTVQQQISIRLRYCLLVLIFFVFPITIPSITYGDSDAILITAEDIGELQAHTMADILNTVPGLSAGSSSVSIHGNSKVKVFLDGRLLNDTTSSHGGIKWDLVTPGNIEKIEILRGKGGVRFGQDASGGVILITSKDTDTSSFQLKTFGGSHDRFFLNSSMLWTKGALSTSFQGGYETTDGYKINNDKERYRGGTTLTYAFSSNNRLSFSADFLNDERGYSGYPDYPTPFSRAETKTQSFTSQLETSSTSSKIYLNRGEKQNSDISRGLDKRIEVDDFGMETHASQKTQNWGVLNYGAAFIWSWASGTSFSDQDETTTSLFLIDTYSLKTIPLQITSGIRINCNSAFDDAVNPEIKFSYKGAWWETTLSYNRTNNTPSFYQRYRESSTTKPNPDLGMEVADNFSLAFAAKFSKTLNGSITGFHNLLADRITYTYGANGTSSYQNVGSATYTGGDLSLTWHPLDPVKLAFNYTYLEAKDEKSGLDLPAKPRHKGRLDLTYSPMDRFSLILTGKGASSSYRNRSNTTRNPGYIICNCKMEYQLEKFDLFMELTNIFDKEYLYVDGLLAPPRAWFAGIQVRL